MKQKSDELYEKLKKAHVEVILDDRDERPGFKFKDWELIGIPFIITVGRGAINGMCEFKERINLEKKEISFDEAFDIVVSKINE